MSQLALDLPKYKNGNGSGKRGRREQNLAADLKTWLADLDAAESLRRNQLHEIAELRAEIYRHAGARGVSPTLLRAARKLMRK
jgi:hypothetical protein